MAPFSYPASLQLTRKFGCIVKNLDVNKEAKQFNQVMKKVHVYLLYIYINAEDFQNFLDLMFLS